MTEQIFHGNLSDIPASSVLERVSAEQLEGVLHFRFWNSDLNTKLIVADGSIGGIVGPFVPSWSASLVPNVVSSERYERVRAEATNAAQALQALIQQGLVEVATLERALAKRVSMGLLPLLGRQDGRFVLVQRPVAQDFVRPGVGIGVTLGDLQMRLQRLTKSFDVNRVVEVRSGDAAALEGLNVQQLEVLSALASGLPLAEVAKRTGLPLDELAITLKELGERGLLVMPPASSLSPQSTAPGVSAPGVSAQGDAKRLRKRLVPGEPAPDFVLPGQGGQPVRLSDLRGKRVLIRFNRQAGCPICNPRNREFIRLYPSLNAANVEVVSIFGSSVEALDHGIGKQQPPYPILADPKDTVYEVYGVERSLMGILSFKNWAAIKEGIAVRKEFDIDANGMDGEVTRMPAEFLVSPEGIIERVHYHAFAADFLPMDTLLGDWLGLRADNLEA